MTNKNSPFIKKSGALELGSSVAKILRTTPSVFVFKSKRRVQLPSVRHDGSVHHIERFSKY